MINKIFIDVSDEQMRGPKTTSSFSFQANINSEFASVKVRVNVTQTA